MKASALVADLLQSLADLRSPYLPPCPLDEFEHSILDDNKVDDLATVQLKAKDWMPQPELTAVTHSGRQPSLHNMDFNIDFGDTSAVQTRGKKKAAKKGQSFNWDEPEENKDGDLPTGEGGDAGNGGAGDTGSGAGGAGGDDNGGNGDNNGEDDWFAGGAKSKKKGKKKTKQEEEDKKKQEEEEAAANANGNADPLSWADDANDAANGEEEWATGFGSKKDTKKKGKKVLCQTTAVRVHVNTNNTCRELLTRHHLTIR